jgi:hypothetical protein
MGSKAKFSGRRAMGRSNARDEGGTTAKTSKPQNGSPSPQNEKLLRFNFLNPITFLESAMVW